MRGQVGRRGGDEGEMVQVGPGGGGEVKGQVGPGGGGR